MKANQSMMEVNMAASFFEWYAGEAMRMNGDVLPNAEPQNRRIIITQPVGVFGFITPWNSPIVRFARKLGPALEAGCSAVLKPSEEAPLTALAFAKTAEQVGMLAGLFNVITASRENTDRVGSAICDSDIVKKISFTGSTHALVNCLHCQARVQGAWRGRPLHGFQLGQRQTSRPESSAVAIP